MEFSVSKADFVRELNLSQGIVEKKTTIPILSNVLLEARDGRLHLSATDLEISMRCSCPAQIAAEGGGTLPVKRLLDYVRLLPDASLNLKFLENDWASLTCGRSRTRLAGMSKDTYPELPETPETLAELPAALLISLISRTIFAIATEDARFTLNGALLLLAGEAMTMVATDGHRLAMVRTSTGVPGLEGVSYRTIVPRKTLGELVRLSQDLAADATLRFSADDNHLFFRVGDRVLISRKLTGTFPDFERVLPDSHTLLATVEKEPFRAALERVAQFADDRSKSFRIRLADGEIGLFSSLSETGESEETVPAEYEGETVQTGFNAHYVIDFLRALPEEKLTIRFKDPKSAGEFRPAGETGLDYRYIIMPMKI
jgi:DNA polymerase III subunit beta